MPVCGCCRFTVVYCLSAFSSAGDSKDSTEMGQYLLRFGYKICVKLMLNRSPTLVSSKSLVCITQWLQYYESTWNRLRTALLLDVTYFSHCILAAFCRHFIKEYMMMMIDCCSTAIRPRYDYSIRRPTIHTTVSRYRYSLIVHFPAGVVSLS